MRGDEITQKEVTSDSKITFDTNGKKMFKDLFKVEIEHQNFFTFTCHVLDI